MDTLLGSYWHFRWVIQNTFCLLWHKWKREKKHTHKLFLLPYSSSSNHLSLCSVPSLKRDREWEEEERKREWKGKALVEKKKTMTAQGHPCTSALSLAIWHKTGRKRDRKGAGGTNTKIRKSLLPALFINFHKLSVLSPPGFLWLIAHLYVACKLKSLNICLTSPLQSRRHKMSLLVHT